MLLIIALLRMMLYPHKQNDKFLKVPYSMPLGLKFKKNVKAWHCIIQLSSNAMGMALLNTKKT